MRVCFFGFFVLVYLFCFRLDFSRSAFRVRSEGDRSFFIGLRVFFFVFFRWGDGFGVGILRVFRGGRLSRDRRWGMRLYF